MSYITLANFTLPHSPLTPLSSTTFVAHVILLHQLQNSNNMFSRPRFTSLLATTLRQRSSQRPTNQSIARLLSSAAPPTPHQMMSSSDDDDDVAQGSQPIHFRKSPTAHPLLVKPLQSGSLPYGSHLGLQQNHVWEESEINERLKNVSTVD
jgi:hypothetical protein